MGAVTPPHGAHQRTTDRDDVRRSKGKSSSANDGRVRPVRVMYVGHTAQLSGGEVALSRLVAALGDDVEAEAVLAEPGPLVRRLEDIGVKVHVLPLSSATKDLRKEDVASLLSAVRRIGSVLAYAVQLSHLLKRERVDVLHANTLKAGFYGCLAARIARIPAVWHVHDRLASDYLPSFAVVVTRLALVVLPQRILCNSSSTLSTIAPGWAPWVRRKSVIAANPLPDDLEPSGSSPTQETEDGAGLNVAMVGRIAPWKGQLVALRGFTRAGLSRGSTLVFFGSPMFGEDAYLDEIRMEIERLGMAEVVSLRGFVDDVSAELKGFDVLVHASLSPEPFGQVIVEGLAAGLPVVASAGGGPSEILTHGQDGLLYEAGDESALAEMLQLLSRDRALRERLRARGLLRARDFSPKVIGPLVLEVYDDLIRTPAGGRRRTGS